ncbi:MULTISPECIES: hypothetical protein [unclassified Pseudomonas]|uniref:hypothetical protein n=1 Tax=unclassified Pseudomonas TaxID=196821 RepID=UPI00244D241C|nr:MULTISPECIES: hypothetical protein [unclassified Pseudomonas]MDG9923364.1 hypothetical protein [Pseudomonas sp. GD04045]MDH0035512.1 hypothetical protein [Pseudomonas sp. GD04019]
MKKWQKILLGIVLVLGAGAWLWWQDEPLNPQAKAWLDEPAAPADSAAYYQLLGLDAPVGQDPQTVGRQLVQAHRHWRAEHGPYDQMVSAGGERIELPGKELCALGEAGCLEQLRQDRAALAELLNRHGELLRRYERLLALNDYRTLSQPSMDEPLANFTTLDRANRLRGAQALALALDERGDEALAILQQDVRQLRAWLARADNLILKMMLVNQLGRDLDTIAALQHAGLVSAPAAQAPLSEAERSLEAPMQREFALVGSGLLTLVDSPETAAAPKWRLLLMYKPHMTVNDMLSDYQQVAANSRLDTAAFVRTVRVPSRSAPSLWRRARNPVGTILGSVAMPDFNKYLARLHDLDAKLALFNALGQAVPEADNPYRPGQRAKWDAKRQAYCFTGPLKDERGVRCLPWPAPPSQ